MQAQDFEYNDSWGKAGFSLENQSRSNVTVNYSIENFSLTESMINGVQMQNISLPGNLLPNDEGAPDLPGSSRYIAVPEGARAVLHITDYRTETYRNVDIAPAPRIPLDTDKGPMHYEKDSKIYAKDALYPAEPIQISTIKQVRGVDAVILGITPFQYNPVSKELVVYRDIRVEIEFEGGSGYIGEDRLRSRWWDPIMQDVFLNSASLPEIDYNKRRQQIMSSRDDAGYEYLIVVPNNPEFSAWADSIKQFRQKQGILTGIMTLDEIGTNTASGLENFFNDAYNNWDIPPAAVLLLADYGTNAANTIISPIYNSYCASDNIYSDVDNDDMPDMIFARITANNDSQLETMVTKFIHYEKNPPTNPDYYAHPITALGWQTERWFQICSESVGGFWRKQGKDPVRANAIYQGSPGSIWSSATNTSTVVNYFGPNGLDYIPQTPAELGGWSGGTATMVNNAINSGAFMLQHRDHGYEQGWGEPAYSSTNINALNNSDLVFVFSINCLTGKYNMGGECFTEKFHRHTYNGQNAGALGLVAASEVSYSFVNDAYVWGMYDNMWPEFMPDYGMPVDERGLLPAFGNVAGKYFLEQSSWPYNTNNKEVTYNLFHHHGGAFLNVYSEMPQNLTVTHDPVLYSGVNSFTVTADAGSFIALTVNGEIIGTAEGTGSPVDIAIDPQLPPNMMMVTITRQNYFRYESEVEIIPPTGPYVVFQEVVLDDVTGGNGDGLMDYAEDILLDITLKNVGVELSQNTTVSLTTEDEFITIINGTADFGVIDPNSTKTVAGAFEIEVAGNIPDNHNVAFEVSASNGTDSWVSNFSLKAHAPKLEVANVTVFDPTGNNNGNLDPGETADLIFNTANNGSSMAYDLEANLSTVSPFVTINSASYSQDELAAGETAEVAFNITISPTAPVGSTVELIYQLTSGMYEIDMIATMKIGLIIEDFESGDFSQYEWQLSGNANWTVEPSGAYEGTYCAKSGDIGDQQNTILMITLEVSSDDTISFYRKVSSEATYDFLRFYIDGNMKDEWSGTSDWEYESYPVTAGTHTFKWEYVKDYYVASGSDCGWIDYISFPAIVDESLMAFAGPDGEICEGANFEPAAVAENYESLLWETSGTGTFNDNTIVDPVYTPSDDDYAAGSVSLTLTAYAGTETMSDNLLLSFMPIPEQCAAPAGETELCADPGATTYTTDGAGNADDYMWVLQPETAGTLTYDGATAEVAWAGDFTGVAELMVMGVNECGEGEMSDVLEISIMGVPATATTPVGDTELCEGNVATMYEVAEIANASEYIWEVIPAEAGTIVSGGMTAELTWATAWTGDAEVTVKGINECGEGEVSAPLMVSMMPLPSVPVMPVGETELCQNSANTVYTTEGAANADGYTWEIVPETAGTLTADGLTAEVDWAEGFEGDASIHVKAMNTCGESEFSDAIMVTLAPVPQTAGAIEGDNEVCQGITETYTVPEILHATSCEWVIEPAEAGTMVDNGMLCDITFSDSWDGTLTLKVRGINDCGSGEWSDAFSILLEDCTGIQENEQAVMNIYPNPTNGDFTIQLSGNDVVEIELMNALGERVYVVSGVEINGNLNRQISVNGLAGGLYYLSVKGETIYSIEKIIIRK
ncbi:MAG: C25 family cysteine peptidase [Bacteroidales bacterium]